MRARELNLLGRKSAFFVIFIQLSMIAYGGVGEAKRKISPREELSHRLPEAYEVDLALTRAQGDFSRGEGLIFNRRADSCAPLSATDKTGDAV